MTRKGDLGLARVPAPEAFGRRAPEDGGAADAPDLVAGSVSLQQTLVHHDPYRFRAYSLPT